VNETAKDKGSGEEPPRSGARRKPAAPSGKASARDDPDHDRPSDNKQPHPDNKPHPQDLAYFIMAGMALGGGIGFGLDKLLGTLPVLMAVGMFAGLAFSLYVAYIRLR
jgi:F0F1-type ATP synthase assembly protein I